MVRRPRPLAASLVLAAMVLAGGCGGATRTSTSPAAVPTTSSGATTGTTGATGPTDGSSTSSTSADPNAPIDATCPTANTTAFAKTKFVAHAGLAFGAFHRYIYKPYQAGSFKSGQSGRVVAFVKAGASALFIKREIRLASEDVKANPSLCKAIAAPLAQVGNSISGAVDRLKNGDASGITAAQSAVTGVESRSTGSGTPIAEDPNAPSN